MLYRFSCSTIKLNYFCKQVVLAEMYPRVKHSVLAERQVVD